MPGAAKILSENQVLTPTTHPNVVPGRSITGTGPLDHVRGTAWVDWGPVSGGWGVHLGAGGQRRPLPALPPLPPAPRPPAALPPCDAMALAGHRRTAAMLLSYYVMSIALTLYNKWMISVFGFKFPLTIVMAQMVICFVCMHLCAARCWLPSGEQLPALLAPRAARRAGAGVAQRAGRGARRRLRLRRRGVLRGGEVDLPGLAAALHLLDRPGAALAAAGGGGAPELPRGGVLVLRPGCLLLDGLLPRGHCRRRVRREDGPDADGPAGR